MLVIDFETRSEADLPEVGAWNYSLHPSTDVLVICYSIDGGPIKDLTTFTECPDDIRQFISGGGSACAFNTSFEYSIWKHILHERYGWPMFADGRWRDTAAKCLASGFPAKLEKAAVALRLDNLKDGAGKALINFFSIPITSGKLKGQFRQPADHPQRFAEFVAYCHQDVQVTMDIEAALPDLSPSELQHWLLTWKMNLRGIAVDLRLVEGLQQLTNTSRTIIGDKLSDATEGQITIADIQNHGKILRFVQGKGVATSSVAKAAVKETLDTDIEESARTVLEARQALGKTSVSKLDTIVNTAGPDNRIRFATLCHGTSTGRDSSGLLQTIPRGGKFDLEQLIHDAESGDTDAFIAHSYTTKGKRIFDPMGAVVTCLRSCFTATPGNTLIQCDWSSVEPRMIAWLAGQTDLLDDFRKVDREKAVDIYQVAAAPFFGLEPDKIVGDYRQFGKVYILQNIYGSAWGSVQKSAKNMYSLLLDEDTARLCVDVFRGTYRHIVAFWANLEQAAVSAVRNHGTVYVCGRIAFCHNGKHLRMKLPSGRLITYPWATIKKGITSWGTEQDQIHYWGVSSQGKVWMEFSIWGSALANHCLGKKTLVLTTRGAIPILEIEPDDLLWDGESWVSHQGVISKGTKRVGLCKGVTMTDNHLIFDGKHWRPASEADDSFMQRSLKWAQDSENSPLFRGVSAETKSFSPSAIVVAPYTELRPNYDEDWNTVKSVGIKVQEEKGQYDTAISNTWIATSCANDGCSVTQECVNAAKILSTLRTTITEQEGLKYVIAGCGTEITSWTTYKKSKDGIWTDSTSTESTMMMGTTLKTSELCRGVSTQTIADARDGLKYLESDYRLPSFIGNTPLNGLKTPSHGIKKKEDHGNKLWKYTGEEEVFDVVDAGPNHRFTVITDDGPIVVHNCTQGSCSCLMRDKVAELDKAGIDVVLRAHDEIVCDVADESLATTLKEIMITPPPWAKDLPLNAGEWRGQRFRKE